MTTRLVLFLLLASSSSLVIGSEFNDRVDAIFSDMNTTVTPGCTVGVIQGTELIHQTGYGLANMELGVELDGSHLHRMASVSKQFTAMAVHLLADDFDLSLQDDIREHIPDLRDYGVEVTINSVLGHVAGMGDYDFISGYDGLPVEGGLNLQSVSGVPFRLGNEDYLSVQEFHDLIKTLPLAMPPNQQWAYSNMGYVLLAVLVEAVSGETLREFADARIFKPLGMTQTFFSDDAVEIIPNRATGYRPNDDGYVTDMTNLFWVGDGGLHTNLDDMLKWDQNFYEPKLGKNPEELMEKFNTPNSNLDSRGNLYANGQFVSEDEGNLVFSHSGGWLGTSTYYRRYPSERLASIIMCNDVGQNPAQYLDRIIEAYRTL